MRQIGVKGAALLLALTWAASAKAQDKDGESSAKSRGETPEARVESTLLEFAAKEKAFQEAYKLAKTDEERRSISDEMSPRQKEYIQRLLALAEAAPRSDAALKALLWIGGTQAQGSEKALEILARDHLDDPKLVGLFGRFESTPTEGVEPFLSTALANAKDRQTRGKAGIALFRSLKAQLAFSQILRTMKAPVQIESYEEFFGKGMVEALKAIDAEAKNKQIERLLEQLVEEYGDVELGRGQSGQVVTVTAIAEGELYEMRHLAIGQVAQEIEGKDIDGKAYKLSDFRGKVVVLDFWATWCGPCMAMVPHERALVKRLKDAPFALIGIGNDDDKDAVKRTMSKENMTWISLWDEGTDGPIARSWNVRAWPTTYVLDPEGVIRAKNVRGDELDKAVDAILKQQKAVTGSGK